MWTLVLSILDKGYSTCAKMHLELDSKFLVGYSWAETLASEGMKSKRFLGDNSMYVFEDRKEDIWVIKDAFSGVGISVQSIVPNIWADAYKYVLNKFWEMKET